MNQATTDRLNRLNALWSRAEDRFRENGVLVTAHVSEGAYHLAIIKIRGKWRLCADGPCKIEEVN